MYVPRDAVTFADIATISKIQAIARGRSMRRKQKEQEAAVVAIQAAFRGYQVRKRHKPAGSLRNYDPPPIGNHKALFLFSAKSPLRRSIHGLMYNTYTETTLLLLIAINMVCMILASPPPPPGSPLEPVLWRIDTALTGVFIGEFFLKVVACGFVFGEHTYLRDSWNRL
eukprot:COSAG03_NODE_5043_length_1356_cov_1.851233_1_plen_168_part_10